MASSIETNRVLLDDSLIIADTEPTQEVITAPVPAHLDAAKSTSTHSPCTDRASHSSNCCENPVFIPYISISEKVTISQSDTHSSSVCNYSLLKRSSNNPDESVNILGFPHFDSCPKKLDTIVATSPTSIQLIASKTTANTLVILHASNLPHSESFVSSVRTDQPSQLSASEPVVQLNLNPSIQTATNSAGLKPSSTLESSQSQGPILNDCTASLKRIERVTFPHAYSLSSTPVQLIPDKLLTSPPSTSPILKHPNESASQFSRFHSPNKSDQLSFRLGSEEAARCFPLSASPHESLNQSAEPKMVLLQSPSLEISSLLISDMTKSISKKGPNANPSTLQNNKESEMPGFGSSCDENEGSPEITDLAYSKLGQCDNKAQGCEEKKIFLI
ncbi:unnamed protein product [Protopolystoma xenopodis]|uniref:Uncharacterized protein n=1 Tax=Protopolystoma xenopodis TaxID=117903 RepID=A0A3S5AV93_9PLAT|nr:unnamed protein product [Protopolystoma xenopodis]